MSKISAIDFANNVRQNKERLIQHCLENGVAASTANTLDEIVSINNEINGAHTGFKVEFVDIDGTVLKTEYVEAGGSATPPTPTFDSDYLEFVEWVYNNTYNLSNVQDDIVCIARYRTKNDTTLNERPTYIKILVNETTGKTVTLNAKVAGANAYIDWGDGSSPETHNTSVTHTYTNDGIYYIKAYGERYAFGSPQSNGANYGFLMTEGNWHLSVLAIYLGEHYSSYNGYNNSYLAYYQYSLEILLIDDNTSLNSSSQQYFSCCYNLKGIIFPSQFTSFNINSGAYQYDDNLVYICTTGAMTTTPNCDAIAVKYLVFKDCTHISNNRFIINAGYKLTKIPIAYLTSLTALSGYGSLYNCPSLKSLTFPENIGEITGLGSLYNLQQLIILNKYATINFVNSYVGIGMLDIVIPANFEGTINLASQHYNKSTYIGLAKKLKDLSGDTAHTFTVYNNYCYAIFNTVYVDANGDEVPAGTTGAKTLLQYVTDKNWTVTFS